MNAKPIILWDNLLAKQGVILSATSSHPDHPVQYIADWREYLSWQAGSASIQSIEADLGSEGSAKALAIYKHNFHSAGISSITLYGSDNGADWIEILSHQIETDAPILKIFNQIFYRYFKLTLAQGSIPVEIGILFIGEYLEFPCWPSSGFDPDQKEQVIEKAFSEQGFVLGAIERYSRRKIQLSFSHLTDLWVRDYFIPFWESHIPKPFLFAWDYINHSSEVYLLEVSEPRVSLPYSPVFRSLRLELEGRV